MAIVPSTVYSFDGFLRGLGKIYVPSLKNFLNWTNCIASSYRMTVNDELVRMKRSGCGFEDNIPALRLK
jgi:hypothetical protein